MALPGHGDLDIISEQRVYINNRQSCMPPFFHEGGIFYSFPKEIFTGNIRFVFVMFSGWILDLTRCPIGWTRT
ncbi:hypothetical protein, partial [Komagataeibacter saccharivorans]|uniref:hypothetical protein n=1 Tax=Komagataeibacter saccharivorans TaxID=265959 RepID=UPI0039EAA61A